MLGAAPAGALDSRLSQVDSPAGVWSAGASGAEAGSLGALVVAVGSLVAVVPLAASADTRGAVAPSLDSGGALGLARGSVGTNSAEASWAEEGATASTGAPEVGPAGAAGGG